MPNDMARLVASRVREMAGDQFRSLAATHGGELAGWPRGNRAPARALLRRRLELVGVLAGQLAMAERGLGP